MPGKLYGERGSDARVPLESELVFHTIQAGTTADPKIPVEGDPEPAVVLDVVAQVPFEGAHRRFRQTSGAWVGRVVREELRVGGEEPHAPVRIEDPMAPALGKTKFRLEGPAVGTPVDEPGGVVLAFRSHQRETDAEQGLLPPGPELLRGHGGAALEIDGEAKDGIEKAGAVNLALRAIHVALKVPKPVG